MVVSFKRQRMLFGVLLLPSASLALLMSSRSRTTPHCRIQQPVKPNRSTRCYNQQQDDSINFAASGGDDESTQANNSPAFSQPVSDDPPPPVYDPPPSTSSSSSKSVLRDDPFSSYSDNSESNPLFTTFGGGTALMFEMIAQKMLDWGNEAATYKDIPTTTTATTTTRGVDVPSETTTSSSNSSSTTTNTTPAMQRWHPHTGISATNPNFRNQAPAMNNQGFAKSIWRNVRKRNKPSLWKNALRTYDRMAIFEETPNSYEQIQRSNPHHEGALVACAKLGLWQRALEIYHSVYQVEQESQAEFNQSQRQSLLKKPSPSSQPAMEQPSTAASSSSSSTTTTASAAAASRRARIRRNVQVTETMIISLVRACVRASRERARFKGETNLNPGEEEREAALRRIPLDTALEIITTMQENHGIPLVAYHVNSLAAAYQNLGYIKQAREILQTTLSNRTAGEEPEEGVDILNVYDLCAKDKGSYSLLVQGAVVTGDWGAAVEALGDMNAAGLYPNQRHCNVWSEISERRTRPRAVGSWKKKRDDYWADSVR